MKRRQLSLAVAKALGAGAIVSLAVPAAYAQQAPVERVQRIEVTGSRIPLQTLESESPVSIITQQDIKMTGLSNVSDILNQMPQVFAEIGQMEANGATGTSTINLRGLGSSRTLVLIDGKRLPAGDRFAIAPDINTIPAALIQRIDILTGGASAVYGSDAIAGVVNFIMNDHFEGVQFNYNANGYQHSQHDGSGVSASVAAHQTAGGITGFEYQVPGDVNWKGVTQDFNLTLGSNFANGKGNATVYFEYRHSDPMLQSRYDYSACSIGSSATGFACAGSSTSYPGRFTNLNAPPHTPNRFTIADTAGNVRPFVSSGVPNDLYNYGPINYYQVPDERYLANFFAHYDAFPNVRVYTEFDYMHSSTVLQIAPSGLFSQEFIVPDTNPFLSPSFKTTFGVTPTTPADMLIGRRNVEGGGRQDVPVHNDFRVVIGAKGDFLDGKWDYDAFWQSAKNDYSDTYLHDVSLTRAARSLNVVKGPNGQPTCQSVIDGTDPLCVPYNIFQIGGVTQAALDYIQVPGLRNSEITQSVVGLHVDSDLGQAYGWKLPWANTGIGVAGGFEHRTEKLNFQVDNEFATGDLTGQGGPSLPVSGQYTVNEAFGEIRVPIAENQPYAKNLAFNASYRWSNYNTGHTTNTYGFGAEWAPIAQARLRGTYQHAVRAANIVELFLPQGLNLFTMLADPCGENPSATVAQCALTGLPANLYGSPLLTNSAGQYNYIQGGNPALNPEKSDSYTLGVVLNPLPKLSATVDYFRIKVKDVIGPIPPSLAVQQCIAAGQFCGLIHRDPRTGALWFGNGFVTGTDVNLGSLKTSGIDVTANYNWDLDNWGGLAFALTGTWLHELITEPVPGLGTYNCAGFYGNTCGTPSPKWRSVFTTTWNTPWSWLAGLRWRYFESVKIDTSSSNALLVGDFNPKDETLGTRNYFDLFAQWDINKNFTLRGGVNNIFDRDPPLTSQGNLPFYNGNTFPNVYDAMGRNFFINVNAKF